MCVLIASSKVNDMSLINDNQLNRLISGHRVQVVHYFFLSCFCENGTWSSFHTSFWHSWVSDRRLWLCGMKQRFICNEFARSTSYWRWMTKWLRLVSLITSPWGMYRSLSNMSSIDCQCDDEDEITVAKRKHCASWLVYVSNHLAAHKSYHQQEHNKDKEKEEQVKWILRCVPQYSIQLRLRKDRPCKNNIFNRQFLRSFLSSLFPTKIIIMWDTHSPAPSWVGRADLPGPGWLGFNVEPDRAN